jgi:hypothetical protein
VASRAATPAALLLAAWGLAGCLESAPAPSHGYLGPDAGSGVPPAQDAGGPSDVALTEAAVAAWSGTWTFTSGSQGIDCGGTLSVVGVSGSLAITETSGGTELMVTEDGCAFRFSLAGDTATEDPGQSCSAWAVPTIPTWTLTLQADGTLREQLGGRVVVNGDVCTISGGSTLARQ